MTKRTIDILWYILLAVFLFCGGIVYQWFVNQRPVYPLTLPGEILDTSK